MGRKRLCDMCRSPMEGPEFIKTKVPLPPVTDCPECEEFRKHGARLTFVKVYTCPKCEKVTTIQMTVEEIKEHRLEFHWGSTDITPEAKELMVQRAKDVQIEEERTEKITKEIITVVQVDNKPVDIIPEISPLEQFLDKLKDCPRVYRVYLSDPRTTASHLVALGWKILELHIVPIGRPPYFEIEKILSEVPRQDDQISEMFGERAFFKISDTIFLVRIFEQAVRLGHI